MFRAPTQARWAPAERRARPPCLSETSAVLLTPGALHAEAAASGLGAASLALRGLGPAATLRLDVAAERLIYPASMIKLPIALVLARLVEAFAYRLDDEVTVDRSNGTTNDLPSPFAAGEPAELGMLARAMLSASDNVATNVLIDVLGRATLTAACASLGLAATAVRRKLSGSLPLIDDPAATGRNSHPAADAAAALEIVAADHARARSWVYDALAAQHWNDKLSRGWDRDDRFAHKTGETDEVSHDGGILTLPDGRRFVVVVYTELPSGPETDARFAEFARRLRPRLEAWR